MGQAQRQPVHAVFRGDDTSLSIAPCAYRFPEAGLPLALSYVNPMQFGKIWLAARQ
jgi:hypothetical protein